MPDDILERLQLDPGRRTIGELIQERAAAVHEIRARQLLVRLSDLCDQLAVSRGTIYRWLGEGKFPRPVRIGERAVRWRAADVEAWCGSLDHATY
jgi:prophage regulatory protein